MERKPSFLNMLTPKLAMQCTRRATCAGKNRYLFFDYITITRYGTISCSQIICQNFSVLKEMYDVLQHNILLNQYHNISCSMSLWDSFQWSHVTSSWPNNRPQKPKKVPEGCCTLCNSAIPRVLGTTLSR